MAAIDNIQGVHGHVGLRARLSAVIARIQENRARRAVYQQTLRELNSLTQRDLDDLGISGLSITRIAREAAYNTAK